MKNLLCLEKIRAYSWECIECGYSNINDIHHGCICISCGYSNDKKEDVKEVEAYSWICSNCDFFNITDTKSEVICEHCHKKFDI